MKTYQTEVRFDEFPLIVETPRLREWGTLDIVVTVEHDGHTPDCWEIVEIELSPAIPGQPESDRHAVPRELFGLIAALIRGREHDRDRVRCAISEGLRTMVEVG